MPSDKIVKTIYVCLMEASEGGIKSKDQQIELKGIVPWIDDLRMKDVFKDEDKKKGAGVTDLINGLVKILRLEIEELWDAVWQVFKPVKP